MRAGGAVDEVDPGGGTAAGMRAPPKRASAQVARKPRASFLA